MHRYIFPVFQPILNVVRGQVLHYEALARTKLVQDSHVELIEIAERIGFIDLIDTAMLRNVVTMLESVQDVRVAVNVSGLTIESSSAEYLAQVYLFKKYAHRLVFEITETKEICDLANLERFITALKVVGGKIALDDFGTGFCTLNFVRKVKPDYVKLAGQTVHYMATTGDESIVREVNSVVANYGGTIIAEHVDSQEKSDMLMNLDIVHQQGYHVGTTVHFLPAKNIEPIPVQGTSKRMLATAE